MLKQQSHQLVKPKRHAGSTIVEYVLPAATALFLCLAGLSMLSGNLNGLFGLMHNRMTTKTSNAQAQLIMQKQAQASFQKQQAGSGSASSWNPNPVCRGNSCSTQLDLNASVVVTTGTNGQMAELSSQAADVYANSAHELTAQGGDPALVTLLTNLANEGHNLANAEKNLDTEDYGAFARAALVFQDGKSTFNQLFGQMSKVLSQLPPSSQSQVTNASKVIMTLADNYNFTQITDDQTTWTFANHTVTLTNKNANKICKSGGNTAACVK